MEKNKEIILSRIVHNRGDSLIFKAIDDGIERDKKMKILDKEKRLQQLKTELEGPEGILKRREYQILQEEIQTLKREPKH